MRGCGLLNTLMAPHFRACLDNGNIVFFQDQADDFQTHEKESWVSVKVRAESILADAVTSDGRKEWTCKFCSETNVWTWWRCRLTSGLQAKHQQALNAKSEERYSGPSSSSGEEEWKCQEQEGIKRLRPKLSCSASSKETGRVRRSSTKANVEEANRA